MSSKHTIESQLPGVFYRRPSPDAEFYVKEGSSVSVGDTIGLIELMKSYHEVKSDVSGEIETFLVDNEGELQPGEGIVVITCP